MPTKPSPKPSHNDAWEQSGLTTFSHIDGSPRKFRFTVAAADNELRIWLEDTVSKEQWCVDNLAPKDFVTDDTTLPQAGAANYAFCVVKCLEARASTTRSLTRPAADGSRVLCVGFVIEIGMFETKLEYTFTLPAVKLEETDRLGAKVRDVEAMIEDLKRENRELKDHVGENQANAVSMLGSRVESLERPMEFVRATTTTDHARGQYLKWQDGSTTTSRIVSFTNGEIKFLQPGVYEINMQLWHKSTSNGVTFELMHGSSSLQKLHAYYTGNVQQTHLLHVFDAKANDTLTVYYRGSHSAYAQSTVTIIRRSVKNYEDGACVGSYASPVSSVESYERNSDYY